MSSRFVVGENGGPSIRELKHLDYPSGQISISGLENVKDDGDASEAILKDKKNLKVLELEWKGNAGDSSQVKKMLERLEPPSHIECITILGYEGIEFPKWVGHKSFSKFKKMLLFGCKNRICLPPLGQLASLEELQICGYAGLEDIGMEFYGDWEAGKKPFSALKRLKFVGMTNWGKWSFSSGVFPFPVLEELELRNCPKLMSVPDHFPSLERLRIEDCHKVECISLKTFLNLKELVLRNCSKLVTLPKGGEHSLLPSLEELELRNCPELMSFPNHLPGLKRLRIEDCPKLDFESLSISTYATLERLRIHSCSKWVSFPAGELHAPNLKEIDLSDCGNLKSLPQGMHSRLPSLKKLSISYCPEIESVSEGGLPSNLRSLEINKCEKLDFVVGENGGPIINVLENLHYLRGEISIRVLENVNNDRVVSEAILKGKLNLKMLKLSWNGNANYSRQVKQVLERLRPHIQIEYIWIRGNRGTEFLNYVRDIMSFSKLKEMRLDGCNNHIWFPPLGQLASLEKLSIIFTCMVIDLDFYGACKPGEKPFKSLKTLEFRGMKKWWEWSSFNGAFPVLEELELCDCPELMSVPNDLPSLKRLRISDCGQLDFENLLISARATLETIDIWDSKKVKRMSLVKFPKLKELLSFPSSLEELVLRDCPELMFVPSHLHSLFTSRDGLFGHLASITIWGCSKLVAFGGEGLDSFCPYLRELELGDCPQLMSVPGDLPRLKRLWISGCGQLDFENLLISAHATLETINVFDNEKVKCISLETFPKLQELDIRDCSNLESLGSTATTTTTTGTSDPLPSSSLIFLTIWGCSKLVTIPIGLSWSSLEELELRYCPELMSFPRGGLHAPNLRIMCLNGCHNLESLPQGMDRLLRSLEKLSIISCPKIKSLPDGGLPASLSSLHIKACPLLKEWCERTGILVQDEENHGFRLDLLMAWPHVPGIIRPSGLSWI